MATKKTTKQARPQGPVVVKNEAAAMDVATESGRKRPFVAINDEGKLVVCSRRTAAKYGWEGQGALFSRTGGSAPAKTAAPAKKASAKKAPWDQEPKQNKQEQAVPAARNLSRTIKRVIRSEFAALSGRARK